MSTDEADTDFDKYGKEEITINHDDHHSLKSMTKTIHCNRIITNYKLKEQKANLFRYVRYVGFPVIISIETYKEV